jgi:Family of unknown function (DUF6228)
VKSKIVLWDVRGRGSLELSNPHLNHRNSFRCVATLTWEGEAFGTELEMITPYRRFWRKYAEELAAGIDGWEGEHAWSSEFGELDLTARNDAGGTAELDVELSQPSELDGPATATLTLRTDDVLRLARDLPAFLRLPD